LAKECKREKEKILDGALAGLSKKRKIPLLCERRRKDSVSVLGPERTDHVKNGRRTGFRFHLLDEIPKDQKKKGTREGGGDGGQKS